MEPSVKVVYQAYGRQDIVNQVLFSVISLAHEWRKAGSTSALEVEIYGDNAHALRDFFASENSPFPIRIVPISSPEIIEWRGAIDFVHRVKLKVLEKASETFGGRLVYLDGDTYFTTSPEALFAKIDDRNSLMHIRESSLGEAKDVLTKKIAKFVHKKEFQVAGEKLSIAPTTEMWNAGVIGLSAKNTDLFAKMVELTDRLYSQYQKHVMEQLAVSYFVQQNTKTHPAANEIVHYWSNKEAFDRSISEFLVQYRNFDGALTNYDRFQWPPPPVPKQKKSWFSFLGF